MSIKPIIPKGIDIQKQKQAIDAGLMAGVEDAKALFYMTYHNWESENYPQWEVIGPRTTTGNREVVYQTQSTPYVWVSNGTPAHPITAKPGGFLRFMAGSRPKTKPGQFQSMAGAAGTIPVLAEVVNNPGITAREFPKDVVIRVQPTLANIVQNKLNKVS
jgi:hypothetical protein